MMIKKIYRNPTRDQLIDSDKIKDLSEEEKLLLMKEWFYSNYEDSSEAPYLEDSYWYITGEPRCANEILEEEFYELIESSIIESLAEELDLEADYWIPREDRGSGYISYEEFKELNPFLEFEASIASIKQLIKISIDRMELKLYFNYMVYANIITIVETYLCDSFLKGIYEDEKYKINYLNTNKKFKDKKIAFCDLVREFRDLDQHIRSSLLDTLWHRLDAVAYLFDGVFEIKIKVPEELKKAVILRHDIVHRNGKNKNGEKTKVGVENIEGLIEFSVNFVKSINDQMQEKGILHKYV